jgi:tight adherence protein B
MSGEMLLLISAFGAGFLLIFGVNLILVDLFQQDRKELRRRIQEEMLQRQREEARHSPLLLQARQPDIDLQDLADEAFRDVARGRHASDRLRAFLHQSGLRMTPGQLLTWSAMSSVIAGGLGALVGLFVTGKLPIMAGLAAAIGAALPFLYVEAKRRERLEALRAQLPDCFELMSRILRAGQTISQAMQSVATEFKAPAGIEFGYCYEQQNLGLAPELALRDLARRTGLLEIKIFVLALLVHRQTGGNLTELLDKLATIVRDRYRIRGKIEGLTAEGKMQGYILLALPVGVYMILLLMNRPYAIKLWTYPALPIVTLISMTLGALWVRKIVNFDY